MKQYAALDDTIYLWFASNDTSGSGGDGASPAADVRLAGAAADAAPVYSPTPVLLTHANYPAGSYEIPIPASAANGFATGNTYAVFCTLAIDSQNPTGFVGSFDLKPIESNMEQCGGSAVAAGAIPNAAADAAGGLPISDAGNLDLDTKLANTNEITAARMGVLTDWINGGRLDLIIDLILADTAELQGNQAAWATATGFSTHSAADIWSVATRALTDKSGFALSTAGINAIWDDLISGITQVGSIGKLIADNLNATITSRAPAGEYDTQMGYIPSNLGDVPIASELNSAHGAGSWATATGFSTHNAAAIWSVATRILTANTNFNDLDAAAVKAEVAAALQDIKLDHLLNIAVDTNWATTVHLDSVIGHMADVGAAATFDRTTDALEAIRNRGDAAWMTATGFSTHSAANVWGVAARTLTANTNLNDPTAAVIAAAVWDKLIADHTGAGSFGLKNQKAVPSETIGDYKANVASLALEATLTEIKGATWAAGTDTLEHIRNKQTDIQTDTAEIGAAGAGLTALGDTRIGNLDAAVSSRLAPAGTLATVTDLTNAPTAGDLTATMKTSVNDQVIDVIKTDTTAEMSQGAPPATPTFEEMIAYIYFKLRNKGLTTATEDAMYADDGTTKIMKATLSDNGTTFEKSEYISGA